MDEQQQNLNSLIQANSVILEKESDITLEEGVFCEFNRTFLWLEPKECLKNKLKYRKNNEDRTIVAISIDRENFDRSFNNLVSGELEKMKFGKILKTLKDNGAKVKIHHQDENFGPFSETECTELNSEDLELLIRQIKIKKQVQLSQL